MVKEQRNIQFSNQDIMDALLMFNSKDVALPDDAKIGVLTLDFNPEITLNIFFTSEDDTREKKMKLSAPYIAAMMLRYCFYKKIPLPKKASKELSIVDGELMMSLSM